ncbi:hypothetical protein [Litoreibacter roseus]|uniref:Glycosyl transferase family 2 n=1 Tax=Litoreibacter roseus TaxID=2601869 RepID=A0A6N6JHY6_9RHOB|nr:hypothetical protein [Litoreibacter roseus]GFE64898.1 hypothetical protein KIN_19720 [Litoreibacter roseus]
MILNSADPDAPGFEQAERILADLGAAPPRRWVERYTSDGMWAERRRLQRDIADRGDWILNADVDEHHAYPGSIGSVIAHCETKGYNAVQGVLIDRLSETGALNPVLETPPLSVQFPLQAEMHLSLMGRGKYHGVDGTTKLMLHSARVLPSRGGHNPSPEGEAPRYLVGGRLATFPGVMRPEFRFAFPFRVDHYKWTATRETTFKRRIETPGVSAAGKEVGGQLTRYLAEHGQIRLQDVAVHKGHRASSSWKFLAFRMRLAARMRAKFAQRSTRPANA